MTAFLDERGWRVHGVDNNMRRDFFGPDGDTTWNLERLVARTSRFEHHALDIRDRDAMLRLVDEVRPSLIVHAAAQPSHDLAAGRPFDDFEANALGTLNLLEAARRSVPESPFAFLSTNKVYGDAPNELELVELETRWDYADPACADGIDETMRIDATMHSLFGASKVAADVMVQEYGRYFGMPTVCFRGGCLTGPNHSGAELHGFLAYLARATAQGLQYRVFGYKGKQVRDNIHSHDVCTAIAAFAEAPRPAAVYNLGGGRANSISMLEAIERFEELFGRSLDWTYVEEARRGDHICYISDLARFRGDYPERDLEHSLDAIVESFAGLPPRRRLLTVAGGAARYAGARVPEQVFVIRPARGLAALGLGELWQYRELLLFLTWRNILVRYKQTLLGFLWAVLQPLLLMVIMTVFFGSYARQAGVPGPVYYLSALVPWTFFAGALSQASNSLVQNANLVSKVYFPRLAAPISGVLAALVDFACAFGVLIVLLVVYGVAPRPAAILVIPALVVLAFITALGAGLWLSALNVSYRDVQYVTPFLIQIGLFMSVFASNVHTQPWRTLLGLNPMAGVIAGFRWALTGTGSGFSVMIIPSILISIVLLVSGTMYFRQVERTFADVI